MPNDDTAVTDGPIYPDAPESLITVWNQRRKPLTAASGESLPPLDCDLAPLLRLKVAPEPKLPPEASSFARKRNDIRRELEGASELMALTALLIAHLRKRTAPPGAAALFQRIWREQGPSLIVEMPPRWLISAAITFGDHGVTEDQRRLGFSLNIFFSMLKLTEFERLASPYSAAEPLPRRRQLQASRLPLDLTKYSLKAGDLDIAMLAQLWEYALAEPVVGPIACHLLDLLNHETTGLFRRLEDLRALKGHQGKIRAALRPLAAE